jgi:hypothetical protein
MRFDLTSQEDITLIILSKTIIRLMKNPFVTTSFVSNPAIVFEVQLSPNLVEEF